MAKGALINCRLRANQRWKYEKKKGCQAILVRRRPSSQNGKLKTETDAKSRKPKADVWRWRESLEPKGQANKVEEMQTAEINCQVCLVWEMRKLIGRTEQTTNFVAQQIGNKFAWKQCAAH